MHARLLIADSSKACDAQETSLSPLMLRQAVRSSRLLHLCQAAAALRLAPGVAAEQGVWSDLTSRAFGAVTQPFGMCDVSKAPPKHQAAPASKPAIPPTSPNGQDMKKRAYTSVDDYDSEIYYPSPQAKIGHPAPEFTAEGADCLITPGMYILHIIPIFDSMFRLAFCAPPHFSQSAMVRTHQL